jgi:hypothetical protein
MAPSWIYPAHHKEKRAVPGQPKTRAKASEKVEHPGKTFADPAHVVTDPDLAIDEKIRALDTMEQDARQLAIATGEGMEGGEETKLRTVLQAKRMLEPEAAFAIVQQTFEARLQDTVGTDAHTVIIRALDAIKAARDALAQRPGVPASPGSPTELKEELAKEKLDP